MTDPCGGLFVNFCGFISHLIGRETINSPEIFSGVHAFTGKTVMVFRMSVKKYDRGKCLGLPVTTA